MNTMKPICNVCGAGKNVNDTGWVRCFGIFDDSPNPTMQTALPNGQPLVGVAAPVNLDVCQTCFPNVTVGQLKTITASLKGAPVLVNIAQAKQILDSLKIVKTVAAPAEAAAMTNVAAPEVGAPVAEGLPALGKTPAA